MKLRCSKEQCKRWSLRCLVICAMVNNTPIGFLGEHLFWEKVPFMWYLPRALGIH